MTPTRHPLLEHGFWDYTTPGAGGMERYTRDDYRLLLDDLAGAGMNSLLVMVKWFTTGYRSRLPFLDQDDDNPVIASDNRLLADVVDEARVRGIRVWLGAVVTALPAGAIETAPIHVWTTLGPGRFRQPIAFYDTDAPGLADKAVAIAREVAGLAPGLAGLLIELEHGAAATPPRITLYDRWAATRGHPLFADLCHGMAGRGFDHPSWREYTTGRRIAFIQEIERAVRADGFAGELAMILETNRGPYTIGHEVDLELFHRHCPGWTGLTYEYEKDTQRAASMDFCVTVPRQFGMKVYYLPRGVMTWSWPPDAWPRAISLEAGWAADVEDIQRFQPDGVWWFGSGTVNDGAHVSRPRLRQAGFSDGTAARRALLRATAALR